MAKFELLDDEPEIEAPTPKSQGRFELLPDEGDKLALAKDITSTSNRFKRGFMNAFHGAAQALQHALPEGAVNSVNEFADRVGGKGTVLGDYLGIKSMKQADLDKMLADESKEYEEAVKLNDPGLDVAGAAGEALAPHNLILGGAGGKASVAKEGLKKTAAKLGLIGGTVGALQPVTSGDYAGEKTGQIALGTGAGAILGPAVAKAADSLSTFVGNRLARGKLAIGDVESGVKQALQKDGVDLTQLPEAVRFELMEDVRKALKNGVQLDAQQLLRKYDFERFGIQPTQGQLTRDPTQYSRELNMKGINGVGEPLANRLSDQQAQIQDQFVRRTMGAKGKYEAGESLIKDIESKNFEMEEKVRGAYKKFKDATGKDISVSLQGLAQDFANVNREFPIPAVVQRRFQEYGLMGGKQTKHMSVDDAEQLIKTINNNYNPMNPAEKRGLDQLRSAVMRSIDESAEAADDTLTAQLGKDARAAARERFKTIEENPAFKAAINKKAAPDDFIKKYVIGGKADEIERLTKLVSPETRDQMRVQFLRHLQSKAFGANAAGDGATRQASFNAELQNIGRKKLVAILGEEGADDMMALGRVMSYIQQRPAGSTVNESGTAAAVMNVLGKIPVAGRALPFVKEFIAKPLEAAGQKKQVQNALTPQIASKKTPPDPRVMRALSRLAGSSTVLGALQASDTSK